MQPPRGLYVTLLCTLIVAIGLSGLLVKRRPEWKPVRRLTMQLDEPGVQAPSSGKSAP